MLRKNFTKGYSEIQAKVREATSNEDWGPTMNQLEEIARASFNALAPVDAF
jgi:epsin